MLNSLIVEATSIDVGKGQWLLEADALSEAINEAVPGDPHELENVRKAVREKTERVRCDLIVGASPNADRVVFRLERPRRGAMRVRLRCCRCAPSDLGAARNRSLPGARLASHPSSELKQHSTTLDHSGDGTMRNYETCSRYCATGSVFEGYSRDSNRNRSGEITMSTVRGHPVMPTGLVVAAHPRSGLSDCADSRSDSQSSMRRAPKRAALSAIAGRHGSIRTAARVLGGHGSP